MRSLAAARIGLVGMGEQVHGAHHGTAGCLAVAALEELDRAGGTAGNRDGHTAFARGQAGGVLDGRGGVFGESGRNGTHWQRDTIVGNMASALEPSRMNVTPAGGSSSVLSNALAVLARSCSARSTI